MYGKESDKKNVSAVRKNVFRGYMSRVVTGKKNATELQVPLHFLGKVSSGNYRNHSCK